MCYLEWGDDAYDENGRQEERVADLERDEQQRRGRAW